MIETLIQMLGIDYEDTDSELYRKLEWIVESTKSRLKVLLGGINPESDLDYIVVEVSIIRYNRIGSEGTQSHSVQGESWNFLNSDFDAYMDDIQAYKDSKNVGNSKGGILWV